MEAEVKTLFEKDINRSINGVIKVQQSDDESIKQELSEYVVTRELQRHFSTFFENYAEALDVPTEKIGVWISGFFGSGKSHFLKMLSYLLANKEVGGKRAIEYFDGKMEDALVYGNMCRAAKVPTETILFNIDSKGGQWKEGATARTALLRAFQRVFYENMGFFGENLKLAKLEQYIDEQGKTQQFREAFERMNGQPWVESREAFEYLEDKVLPVLQEVLGMSESAVQHWFDGGEDDVIAVDRFAEQVRKYVDSRAAENGGQFRLLFMVDEAGQFIGSDTSLMLSLQTLVEELGSRCGGKVWVVVTSQEAIDEIDMIVGDDFSKIQGRFNTRLSLSSSSVDEVIKRRVLQKTVPATQVLTEEYAGQETVLRNLFTFEGSRSDLIGYADANDFVEAYPFIEYQFKLLPDVFEEIRKRGVKAQHMSTGERSMLSAFQESVQAVQNESLSALVPFWRFFDTIAKDLEHGIIRVVDRAERAAEAGQNLQQEDIRVLKLLYLIRYVTYLDATLDNIAILMVESMDVDKVQLRETVKASLDRLIREGYVSRQGTTYQFLTDEEQDITREINAEPVQESEVVELIKKILFDDIYNNRKLTVGANDFPVDRYVDNSLHGASQGGMKLSVVTLANPDLAAASDGELELRSTDQAIIKLSDEADYYKVLLNAVRIDRYARTRATSQLPESTQSIIRAKKEESALNKREAKALLENAVLHAHCAINGHMENIRATSAKQVFDQVLQKLAEATFTKAGYITRPAASAEDVRLALRGMLQTSLEGTGGANQQAEEEVQTYLALQARQYQETTLGAILRKYETKPFGWRPVDTQLVVAQLVADQKATLSYAGQRVAASDPQALALLTTSNARETDKAVVEQRVRASEKLLKGAAATISKFCGNAISSEDEDALVQRIISELTEAQDHCAELNRAYYVGLAREFPYPGSKVVEDGAHAISQVLSQKSQPEALLHAVKDAEDDLLNYSEDIEEVDEFFNRQKRLFDDAVNTLMLARKDDFYLKENGEAQAALVGMKEILGLKKPYRRISELPELRKRFEAAHSQLVKANCNELLTKVKREREQLEQYAADQGEFADTAKRAVEDWGRTCSALESQIHNAETASEIDSLKSRLETSCGQAYQSIEDAVAAAQAKKQREVAVKAVTPEGEAITHVHQVSTPQPKPAPKIKTVNRTDVCPRKKLSNADEVDAYLAEVREKLLAALAENDSIRLN